MAIICSTPNKGAIFLYSFFFSDAYMCRIDGILLGYRELFVWRKFENNWSAFLSDIQINVGKRKIPIFRGKVDELCLNFSCVFLRSCFKDLWIFKVILLMELSKLKFLKSLKELSDLILYSNCHGIFLYLKDFEFTLKWEFKNFWRFRKISREFMKVYSKSEIIVKALYMISRCFYKLYIKFT